MNTYTHRLAFTVEVHVSFRTMRRQKAAGAPSAPTKAGKEIEAKLQTATWRGMRVCILRFLHALGPGVLDTI